MTAAVARRVLDSPHALEKPLPPTPPTITLVTSSDNNDQLQNGEQDHHLDRAASYTALPRFAEEDDTPIKRTFSENVLSVSSESTKRPPPEEQASGKDILRRVSVRRANDSPKVNGATFDLSPDEITKDVAFSPDVAIVVERIDRAKMPKARSSSRTFGSFTRGSWFSSSPTRSPSPSPKEKKGKPEKLRSISPTKSPRRSRTLEPRVLEDIPPPADQVPTLTKKGSAFGRAGRRPLSVLLPQRKPEADPTKFKSPSAVSLRASKSFEKLPSFSPMRSKPSVEKVPPVPHSYSTERLQPFKFDDSKKKDELWNVFRSLEGDYSKFQSKSSALKANVIRSSLIPFLSRYANHQSYRSLRPEDLDRRINILNKWWIGLLEMLNGKNNQAINGVDRPIFLEGVTGIMTRPEWRIPPFPSSAATLTDKISSEKSEKGQKPSLKSRSTTSIESNGSDFLVESIFHNIRNIFTQNLLSQMAFVVERMSLKNAPASLVTFCGKAIAYAFFFCSGVADILIRLWEPSPTTIRATVRIYVEGLGDNLTSTSKEVAASFPPSLRPLAFRSHASFVRYLRQRVPLPLGAGSIRWHSPGWKRRWTGKDSDLFFVFAKHYHILASQLLPTEVERKARVCIPGLVSVHGQILALIEDTLKKGGQEQVAPPVTFDEVLDGGADASAALPLPATGLRSMAESRLIMLLRDVLAETCPELNPSRRFFADSFADVLKAVARKTSQFDSYTCYSFCDFMEEVITIMFRYRNSVSGDTAILDWPFWMGVLRLMMASQNTLTEIRVITFLYSMWNTIVTDEDRKRDLCLGWLLEESFFRQVFNHWCPMVRGYFHRLLCWKMARLDGDPSDLDIEIYKTFLERLRTNWAHILFLQRKADEAERIPPSTAPCSPAPQRRLYIIRDENQPLTSNTMMSFDHVVPNSSANQPTAYKRDSLMLSLSQADVPPAPNQKNKRWSILKNIFPTNSNGRPGEVTPPQSSSDNDSLSTLDSSNSSGGSTTNLSGMEPIHPEVNADIPPHQVCSFRFSLEWVHRPMFPRQNQILYTPTLPAAAENALHLRGWIGEEVIPVEPREIPESSIKYAGRALAEWAGIVDECAIFYERRKKEGVPTDRQVETPMLAADNFQHPR